MFEAVERATVLYCDPHQEHLHILMTDPYGPRGLVLMAPVCTVRKRHDKACLLYKGDHSFIKDPSYVAYAICRLEEAQKIGRGVETGLFKDCGLLDENVYSRVLAGFEISKFVRPIDKNHLLAARA